MTTPLLPAAPGGDTPPADPPKPTDPAKPAEGGSALPGSGVDFGEDLDKWKHFARQHEADRDRWRTAAETAQGELAKVQRENQTDAERAVSDARDEGRREGRAESRQVLARLAVDAAAARAGVVASAAVLDRLNLTDLVGEDNRVDEAAVNELVSGFAPAAGSGSSTPPPPPPDPAQRGRNRGEGGKTTPDDRYAAAVEKYRTKYPKP